MIPKKIIFLSFLICTLSFSWAQEDKTYISLEQAIEQALNNSHKAIDARLEVAKALKQKWETTAPGLPQIEGEANYHNNLKQPVTLVPGEFMGGAPGSFMPLTFGTKQSLSGSLTLSQLIFDGSYLVGLKAAKVFLEYTDTNEQKTKAEIESSITMAYASVLVAQELNAILDNNIEQLESNIFETEKLYENGFVEEEAVEQLQITLLEMQSQKRSARVNLELAKQMLNLGLAWDINTNITLTDSLEDMSVTSLELQLLDKDVDLSETIDIKVLDILVKQRELELQLERSKALPSLHAFLNYGTSAYGDSFKFFNSQQDWYNASTFGIGLKVPIFSSGLRSASSKKAKFALEQAENQLDEVSKQIQINVSKHQNDLQLSIENMDSSKQKLSLAEKIEHKNKIKFSEGMATSFDWRQAQIQLYASQQEYINAILEFLDAKVKLEAILKTIQ